MAKTSKMKRKPEIVEEVITVDDFIEAQLAEYIQLHKKHEKEISYIG